MRTSDQLQRTAADTGFPADSLEKVLNLIALLDGLRSHPFLWDRLALKEYYSTPHFSSRGTRWARPPATRL